MCSHTPSKISSDFSSDALADIDTDEDKQDLIEPEACDFLNDYDDSLTQSPPTLLEDLQDNVLDGPLSAMADVPSARSSIAATFRGFCSELFVYGKCHRRDSGCSFHHSSAGQERCIHSFHLLAKRELILHSQLPPWAPTKSAQSSSITSRPVISASRPDQRATYRPDQRNDTRYPRNPNRHPGANASSRTSSA